MMVKILKGDSRFKQIEQTIIPKHFPNMAYIMINLKENIKTNGVIHPDIGDLYAVADEEGLDILIEMAKKLEISGKAVLLNVMPLENELGVLE